MKKVLVPRVRFKGFGEEWKEHTIGNIANITNGKSNTSDNNKWGQYNLYIRSEEIYKSNKYIFDVEGVITVGDGNIGKIFHYVNGKFDLHQRCYLIYEFQNIWPKYFYYYFSQNFYKRAILMSYTATVNSIRMNTITDMDIMFPKELIEQQKIGKLLDEISNLINLENSKLNKLKQLKEALLQKMFPEGNSKTPKIRFRGFDEEWKEEVLGKIIKSAYIGISSKILITGKYEVIQQGITNIAGYTNEKPFENYEKIVLFGDHSLSVYKPKKPFLLASDGIKAYFIENTYGDYFYYLLGNNLPENEGYKRYSLILKEKNIWITYNKSEQQKIGDFFSKIDILLNLYNSKLNKLKQIKEALLQKMFV
ncbi:restriction endonuclease subunit S [Mycoplasmopsis felis]|uniref:restriction endonuclease subunit S n=1 Tax=Mycoplasmopsis felis TaxID=33923 RepID=UPI003A4D9941